MLAEAEERIEREAPEAPQATKNRAAIRFIGYLYEAPPVNPSRNISTPESAFRNSGARDLLSPWRDLVSAKV